MGGGGVGVGGGVSGGGGVGVGLGGQSGCEQRIEVFVKIQKEKKKIFFLGGGGPVGRTKSTNVQKGIVQY